MMTRRTFLQLAGVGVCVSATGFPLEAAIHQPKDELFDISLAQWSLNRTIRSGKMNNLDFPKVAKEKYGIECIEPVDQFFADKSKDQAYLKDFRKRADDLGVRIGLLMLDTNGALGPSSQEERAKSIDKTKAWIDAAKVLGCGSVRINARGSNDREELKKNIIASCTTLADYAAKENINIVIENHGGPSSDAAWLASVMNEVNRKNFGTLPDFGNFDANTNRYEAVELLLPYAKAVSAKSMRFSPDGEITDTDFRRMMRLVRDSGYRGYVGIESSPGSGDQEDAAIKWTRDALVKIRDEQRRVKPIFNGKNLDGWKKIEEGEWSVENGVLTGRNGINWTTNPEKTGSWLSTAKQYSDFRLELQFQVNKNGNSGVFFRSAHEKNPAFTGYEMQIHDSPGRPPSKGGPGSLYDFAAPTKNVIRAAGQGWNSATIIAKGSKITIEMNGEKILETEGNRSPKGYIGLQNHDDKSVVHFRNIRLEELS